MRMRKKKWAPGELDACPFYLDDTSGKRGAWRGLFKHAGELHVELGCGKCVSTARMARENPSVNFLALDLSRDVLAVGCRNVSAAYAGDPVHNLILTHHNLMYAEQIFAPEDAVDRLYISFCNPWDVRDKHEKRRLTHTRQLLQYRTFLKPGAQLHFKTDNDELFDDTLGYLSETGFEVTYLTRDLHQSGYAPNYVSEHEKMFSAQGVAIKFLIARMQPLSEEKARALRGEWLGDEARQREILRPEDEA